MNVKRITDKIYLSSFLKTNYCLFSYHLGDLDDFYFQYSSYLALINEVTNNIEEIILIFEKFGIPTVLALGTSQLFESFLEEILDQLPEKFYCHYLLKHEKIFKKYFDMVDLGLHQKMSFKEKSINEITENSNIVNLHRIHLVELQNLYQQSYPDTYFNEKMLDTGYYYGLLDTNHKIIAVVGIHTYSKEFNMAVIGNITTHPDHRGKGYGHMLLEKLLFELSLKVTNISLNVKKNNIQAISLYEKLGFEHCVDYKEALFENFH